jgi:Cof subfamily protein (haloacid dehalogenase superfamily)
LKGIIALDIDGTITVDHHFISTQVVAFLESLENNGWQLFFITGRTFKWGYEVLRYINCPYYFAVQNGAIILEMPSRKIISTRYLDSNVIPLMEMACVGEPSNFVIYAGHEYEDYCYYRPKTFEPEMLAYIQKRKDVLRELWIEVDSFESLPMNQFASVKAFGTFASAQRIIERIEEKIKEHVPLIRDPFQNDCYVVQVTHSKVNKGEAVKDLKKRLNPSAFVIAAGDDNNDRSMLAIADFKIVMATAPEDMRLSAHMVAPSALENGIIEGLTVAINSIGL